VPTGHPNARCQDIENFGEVLELQTVVYDEGGEQEEIVVRHLLHIGIGVIPKKIDRNGYKAILALTGRSSIARGRA
jgi:hypothetical protein